MRKAIPNASVSVDQSCSVFIVNDIHDAGADRRAARRRLGVRAAHVAKAHPLRRIVEHRALGRVAQPADRGVVVVGAGVDDAVRRVAFGSILGGLRIVAERELKHAHAGKIELVAQRVHIRRDDTEVFRDDGQRPQFIGDGFEGAIKTAANKLEDEKGKIQAAAKDLTEKLFGKRLVIYSEASTEAVSIRFRQQVNENSKELCWHHAIPEMNHNELVGWAGGGAVLEGMALGLCPVVSDLFSDILDAHSGYVVKRGDAEALAGALADCARGREERRAKGERAKQAIANRHSPQREAKEYLAALERCVREK